MKYIASCSFGKDSIATILLAHVHNEPLTDIVFSEVMFDHERGISGEDPVHIKWIYDTAIPKLNEILGAVNIHILRSDKDYLQIFHYIPNGKYYPKKTGFVVGGKCIANRELKVKPIKKFLNQLNEDFIQYVGIAKDEPKRLLRLKGSTKISLLDKYNFSEKDAMKLCEDYNLRSPIYDYSSRGGVGFALMLDYPN